MSGLRAHPRTSASLCSASRVLAFVHAPHSCGGGYARRECVSVKYFCQDAGSQSDIRALSPDGPSPVSMQGRGATSCSGNRWQPAGPQSIAHQTVWGLMASREAGLVQDGSVVATVATRGSTAAWWHELHEHVSGPCEYCLHGVTAWGTWLPPGRGSKVWGADKGMLQQLA